MAESARTSGGPRRAALAMGLVALAATLALKPVPLWLGLPVAAALLLLAARLRGRLRPWPWREGLLLAAVTAGCVLLLEGAARLLFFPTTPAASHRDFHPEYAVTLRPNSAADHVVPLEDGTRLSVPVVVSSQGLRDREFGPKAPGEFRIALLGDSFAAGAGVHPEETTGRQLEALLAAVPLTRRVTVMNLGVGGFGPWQERGFLRDRGFPREPDLVIHQILMQNDLDDTLRREDRALRAFDRERFGRWLVQRYADRWQVQADLTLWRHARLYQVYNKATGEPLAFARALLALRGTAFSLPAIPECAPRPPYLEHLLRESYPELDEAFAKMGEDILATRADCRARGIDYAAYAQPSGPYVSEAIFRSMLGGMDPARYDREKDIAPLEAFFMREGIEYASVGPVLRAQPDPCALFYVLDGHMTPAGHRIVAECLQRYFLEVYLPRHGAAKGLARK